jgi:NAD(P)-dependent dehydrogenase (short-subunit alcohol dehydrogenase family)
MILIGSLAAKRQNTVSGTAYTASKHALSGPALSLAAEEQRHGIRVTVVQPGLVNTPILDRRPAPPPPEARARAVQPEDLADTASS